MKKVVIAGKIREALGKKDSKNLRDQDLVPCVLYGSKEPLHFQAPFNDFRKIIYTPNVYLIDLEIGGSIYTSIIQDIQWHPVEEQILHIDFLQIFEDKPVKIEVPVNLVGFAKGIKAGGKMKSNMRKLKIKALPKHLPDSIDVNVENLGLGQSVKVGNLSIENIELLNPKSSVIATVAITRAARAAATPVKASK